MPTFLATTTEEVLFKLPHRAVILLRGCPGAGKSYFVDLLEKYLGSPYAPFEVVSADHYFVEKETGDYVFNKHLLGQAHAACYENFEYFTSLHGDKRPLYIIVDNTNTTMKEMEQYINRAKEMDLDVIAVTLLTNPFVAAARNIHGVPQDKVIEMYNRLIKTELPENITHYVVK